MDMLHDFYVEVPKITLISSVGQQKADDTRYPLCYVIKLE